MNHLSQKIKSNAGATLLIAIMFMLFCVFIGGSVLAAATANGSRLKKSVDSEQAYLSQRSAALLIAEQLYSTDEVEIDYYPASGVSGFGLVDLAMPEGAIPALRELAYLCAAEHYRDTCGDAFCNSTYSRGSVVIADGLAQVDFSLRLEDPAETLYARMYCDTNYTIIVSFFDDESYTTMSDMLYLKMPTSSVESLVSKVEDVEEAGADEGGPEDGIKVVWGMPTVIKGGAEL